MPGNGIFPCHTDISVFFDTAQVSSSLMETVHASGSRLMTESYTFYVSLPSIMVMLDLSEPFVPSGAILVAPQSLLSFYNVLLNETAHRLIILYAIIDPTSDTI